MHFLIGAVVFCPLISALVFIAPQATLDAIEALHPQGWSPRPTDPPAFNIELLKRQSSSSLTQIEGPDSYCGYQFGLQGKFGLPGTHLVINNPLKMADWDCAKHQPVDLQQDLTSMGRSTAMMPPHLHQDGHGRLAWVAPSL